MSRKNILILIAVFVALGIGYFVFASTDDDSPAPGGLDTQIVPQDEGNDTDTGGDEPEATDSTTESPTKPSVQTATTVLEKPVAYTSFGHSADKPLPQGQSTSTTCTTDAKVECYITFVEAGGEEIQFDAKTTDGDGGAVWSWTGGQEVGSGTWTVTAYAGDKQSDPDTIYVQ